MKLSPPSVLFGTVGVLFGLKIISAPESFRDKLPYAFDIASTSSNFFASLGMAMVATELCILPTENPKERKIKNALLLGGIGLLNLAVENPLVNSLIVPDEAQVVLGAGHSGELRDLTYGIIGGILGSLAITKYSVPSATKNEEPVA